MNLTYKFTSKHANLDKLKDIYKLSYVYKRYYNILSKVSMSKFYMDGKIPKYLTLLEKFSEENFSERYKQTCGKQLKGNLESLLYQLIFTHHINLYRD